MVEVAKLTGDAAFRRAIKDNDSWIDFRTFCISSFSASIDFTVLSRREMSLKTRVIFQTLKVSPNNLLVRQCDGRQFLIRFI